MLEKALYLVLGASLGFLSKIFLERKQNRKKKKEARNLLLAELSAVKKNVPALIKSFQLEFGLMINVNYTNPPIEKGSFEFVRQDLLYLQRQDLEVLLSYYKSLQFCQEYFENIHKTQETNQKNVIGHLIRSTLEKIQMKIPEVETILSK